MRALVAACLFGVAGAALLPAAPAKAWWDGYHRWHRDYYRRPPIVVVAPPPPAYYRPYARWLPPHYNRWGQYMPGRWG